MALEMDQEIAGILGWQHIAEDSWWEENWYDTSEVKGLSGTSPFSHDRCPIPMFSTDLNAASTLIVEGYFLELRERNEQIRGKWFAQFFNDNFLNAATGWSDNPAEAICKAWLELHTYIKSK